MILLKFFYCFIAIVIAAIWLTLCLVGKFTSIVSKIIAAAFILIAIFFLIIGLIFF